MPDKHEVGGSSPLSPIIFLKFRKHLKMLKCLQNLMKIKFRKCSLKTE